MNSNCAWRSGGDEPSRVWRLAGRLNPFALSNAATVRSVRWCSCRASSSASLAVLLPVHNRGDSGGPRVTGSTSVSNARSNSGSVWVTGFRPAPTRRKRSDTAARGDFRRRFRSHRPTATVLRASPVAAAPAETPPPPKPIASAAAHCRRTRSSITGANLVHHGSQRRVFLPLPFDRGRVPHAASVAVPPKPAKTNLLSLFFRGSLNEANVALSPA